MYHDVTEQTYELGLFIYMRTCKHCLEVSRVDVIRRFPPEIWNF